MTMRNLLACGVAAWLSALTPVVAQNTPNKMKDGVLDLSVPESPAFTALSLTPLTVVRPASPRSFASSLLNGVDRYGNFQTGVAIDFAPYMLLRGNSVTLQEYRRDDFGGRLTRLLARTQLSVGVVKSATSTDKSARAAAGLSFVLFDKGDARLDAQFTERLAKIGLEALQSVPPLSPNATPVEMEEWQKKVERALETAAKPLRQARAKKSWNRSSWMLAGAPSWISTDGTTSHLDYNGARVWTSLAYGFEGLQGLQDHAQLIFHARYSNKESDPDPVTGKYYKQDASVFGIRVRLGHAETNGSIESAYLHARPFNLRVENFFRTTIGMEHKITDKLWLHVGVGGESGSRLGQNKLMILGTFEWGVAPD